MTTLAGRGILVVEDQPLIAGDIAEALERAGAVVTTASTVTQALLAVDREGISAAIVDHALPDGSSEPVCKRLGERGIPFLIYSGFEDLASGSCEGAPHVGKPASQLGLVSAMVELLFLNRAARGVEAPNLGAPL
jgi:CheY-like chemotaxis protein